MEIHKTCTFFGHRNTDCTEYLKQKVKSVVTDLIVEHGVTHFLFGSRSSFVSLCLEVVTEIKTNYPYIRRIAYTCRHETCTLECEKETWLKRYSYANNNFRLQTVDEEILYPHREKTSKSSYIQHNFAMIDASNYCVFYYNDQYKPPKRKLNKRSLSTYQPNSGTKLAYNYAMRKNVVIINVKE